MWITLNETEQRLAKHLARLRYRQNRRDGVTNRKIGPQSNEMTDLEGIGAEIAFCKANNIYPDLETDHYPDEDALMRDGRRVDIKSTVYETGHLLCLLSKRDKPADVYALVVGKFPRYRIAGYMTAEELMRQERIKDMGHGPVYCASQGELS